MRAIRGWDAWGILFFFFCGNERWWGWTQCSSNHNTFTNPFLKTAGGETPHAALPEVSRSSAATFLWSLLDCHASQQYGLGWGGLVETPVLSKQWRSDSGNSYLTDWQREGGCWDAFRKTDKLADLTVYLRLCVKSLLWFASLHTLQSGRQASMSTRQLQGYNT